MVIQQDWDPTCNRFIAFLDILGFKDRVFRDEFESIYNDLLSFRELLNHIEEMSGMIAADRITSPPVKRARPKTVNFSDSFFLVSGNDSALSLTLIAILTQEIVEKAISLGIPIKGAIAYGEQTADISNSIYFGKPLINAYELQDQILLYSVVLHDSAAQRFRQLNDPELDNFFIKYNAPFKIGTVSHYLLKAHANDQLIEQVKAFYNTVPVSKKCYIDNTLHFLEFINPSVI